jgi:putative zinc finger protein
VTDTLVPEGDRNALLAYHYGEGDERARAETRAHLEGCASCRDYLAGLAELELALRLWSDELPPAGGWARVRARIALATPPPRTRPLPDAAALLGLVPLMAAGLALARLLAGRLSALAWWPHLESWPVVSSLGSFGIAVVVLLLLGGLGSLALAPALLLESRKNGGAAHA